MERGLQEVPSVFLEEEAVWYGHPFISEGDASLCLQFSSVIAL